MSKIKSFRGMMTNGTQDVVSLHTNNGSIGYRIKDFKIISKSPGASSEEDVVKIFSTPQVVSDINANIDFSDQTLLGVAFAGVNAGAWYASENIIFDNVTFNQDIYITFKKDAGSSPVNYYIELEQFAIDLTENTTATLRDIRNIKGGLFPTP